MGNAVVKTDDECTEFDASEELRLSNTSVWSDLSVQVDDAISITTDSTATTTEYESANENETFSNRMSSGTDISYDIALEVKQPSPEELPIINKVSCSSESTHSEFLRHSETFSAQEAFIANMKEDNLPKTQSSSGFEIVQHVPVKMKLIENELLSGSRNNMWKEPEPLEMEFVRKGTNYTRNDKRKKLTKKPSASQCVQKLPHVYQDFLILNYDQVFEQKGKTNKDVEQPDMDKIGNIFCKALDQVSGLLETSKSSEKSHEFPDLTEYLDFDLASPINFVMILYDIEIQHFLNCRCKYAAFFNFHCRNAFLFYNDKMHRLHESFVKRFFSQKFCVFLDQVVFVVKAHLQGFYFAAEITQKNVQEFVNLFGLRDASDKDFRFNVNGVDFLPSVKSEILDCAFQFSSIESDVMNCKENISEAGPATAADIDGVNNAFFNDSADLDFISKMGGTGVVAENLRKQSLYVKFDPLVAQDANSSVNNNDETLKFNDTSNLTDGDVKDADKTDIESSENITQTSDNSGSTINENGYIGKLISVTPNKSPRKVTPKSSPRYLDTDPDDVAKLHSLLLKQMKREELFKEEIESAKQEYEQALKKLQSVEQENSNLKSILEAVQENEKKLKNELKERLKSKHELSLILEEYEKTVSQLVNKRDEEQKEYEMSIKKIEAERDSSLQHLHNLENAFNDIHQKYERGKTVNEALKKNEDALKKSLSEYEITVKTVENKYELLKSHATSQLEKANQELELITQSYEKEQAKLKAMLRKSEIQINSLQNALERKTKENQELTAICDELIVKLSTHSNA